MHTATATATATITHSATRPGAAAWIAERIGRLWAPSPARTDVLDATRVARIEHPRGRRISCIAGALWITFDGEPNDTVLEAGQSLVCEHDTPVLVSAFGMATWRAD
jgi:hypothetical protein